MKTVVAVFIICVCVHCATSAPALEDESVDTYLMPSAGATDDFRGWQPGNCPGFSPRKNPGRQRDEELTPRGNPSQNPEYPGTGFSGMQPGNFPNMFPGGTSRGRPDDKYNRGSWFQKPGNFPGGLPGDFPGSFPRGPPDEEPEEKPKGIPDNSSDSSAEEKPRGQPDENSDLPTNKRPKGQPDNTNNPDDTTRKNPDRDSERLPKGKYNPESRFRKRFPILNCGIHSLVCRWYCPGGYRRYYPPHFFRGFNGCSIWPFHGNFPYFPRERPGDKPSFPPEKKPQGRPDEESDSSNEKIPTKQPKEEPDYASGDTDFPDAFPGETPRKQPTSKPDSSRDKNHGYEPEVFIGDSPDTSSPGNIPEDYPSVSPSVNPEEKPESSPKKILTGNSGNEEILEEWRIIGA